MAPLVHTVTSCGTTSADTAHYRFCKQVLRYKPMIHIVAHGDAVNVLINGFRLLESVNVFVFLTFLSTKVKMHQEQKSGKTHYILIFLPTDFKHMLRERSANLNITQ